MNGKSTGDAEAFTRTWLAACWTAGLTLAKGEEPMAATSERSNLPALITPDVESEAKALLAARFALSKPALLEPQRTTAEEAERSFLKVVTTTFTQIGAVGPATEKLIEEWKKVTAQREKLVERGRAVAEINDALGHRWDDLAAGHPSKALEAYLEQHRRLLGTRREEQSHSLDAIDRELKWSTDKLDDLHAAVAPAGGEAKGARKS